MESGRKRTIVISKYFDKNTFLIAGVCSNCYLQDDDVKIIAVNRKFIKTTKKLKAGTFINTNKSNSNTTNITDIPSHNHEIRPWFDNNSDQRETSSNISQTTWIPPPSPHNLIEESLYNNPWGLLVATIFLNRTSCMNARPRVAQFLRDYPDPRLVIQHKPQQLEKYFFDLGLHKKRAEQIWKMSFDYINKTWNNPSELYGIGKYGEDAYKIFIMGDLECEPNDRFLRVYRNWVRLKLKEDDSNNN